MSVWDEYPQDYRAEEVRFACAVRAGECVSVVGCERRGQEQLDGFLANRWVGAGGPAPPFCDRNRLEAAEPDLHPFGRSPGSEQPVTALRGLEPVVEQGAENPAGLCLLLDRFDVLNNSSPSTTTLSSLRAS